MAGMKRLHPRPLLLSLVFVLACLQPPPGALVTGPRADEYRGAIAALVDDWRAHPDLPSLDSPECQHVIDTVTVRTFDAAPDPEAEWGHQTTLCPILAGGRCSDIGACNPDGPCVTGTLMWDAGMPVIYLPPGEDVHGFRQAVRHEMAHALGFCSGLGLMRNHPTSSPAELAVWGPSGSGGVVWNGAGRDAIEAAHLRGR